MQTFLFVVSAFEGVLVGRGGLNGPTTVCQSL